MSRTWHVARKDLHRLVLPTLAWLLVVVVPTALLAGIRPTIAGDLASGLDAWQTIVSLWSRVLLGMQLVIAYVLAGALVLEDPVVGTNAFWATRPMAGIRLMTAKLLAAAVLFAIVPVLALIPVWVACGFGAAAVLTSAGEMMKQVGPVVLVAVSLASLVRNLSQFLLASLVVALAFTATSVIPAMLWRTAPMAVRASREALVLGAAVPMVVLIAMHQFLTRRARRSWVLVAVALLVAAAIRAAWPWPFPELSAVRVVSNPQQLAADVAVGRTFTVYSNRGNELPSLRGTTVWRRERFCVPMFARSPTDGTVRMRGEQNWVGEAALRELGYGSDTTPLRWAMTQAGRPERDPAFAGAVEVWAVRPRVLGEAPLRVGSESTRDGQHFRVVGLRWHEDRLDDIYLEEREPQATGVHGLKRNWSASDPDSARHVDCYVIVDRATGRARATGAGEIGPTVAMNGVAVGFRALGVSWPRTPSEPVLIKVRFVCDQRFIVPVNVHGVEVLRPSRKS